MTKDRQQVHEGMSVVGTDREPVGQVEAVGSQHIAVARPSRSSIYLSFKDVQRVVGNHVILNIPAEEANTMNWPEPPKQTGSVTNMAIRSRVHEGTEVVGEDQRVVGHVEAIAVGRFLRVRRRRQSDLYVPFDFVRDLTGNRVVLTIPAELADKMDWMSPPVIGDERIGYEGS